MLLSSLVSVTTECDSGHINASLVAFHKECLPLRGHLTHSRAPALAISQALTRQRLLSALF